MSVLQVALKFLKVIVLKGQIPKSLGNCTKLTQLWLGNNQLTGKCMIRVHFSLEFLSVVFFLTGEIPVSLGNCIKLEWLDLSSNKLEGKCIIHTTILPGNLLSKILHLRTFIGTESSEKTLGQQLPDCNILV